LLALVVAALFAGGPPAPAQAAPEFNDWTSVSNNVAFGTLLGSSITLAGNVVDPPPISVLDGTSQMYVKSYFSPPLANTDALQFRSGVGYSYRLTFGTEVQDPVLHLESIASTLTFPAGTPVTRLSGEFGFAVSGSSVSGVLDSGSNDTGGTIRLTGVYSSLTFTATPPATVNEDGIAILVGGTRPPDTQPPPPPGSDGDADNDLVADALDCDDLNPAIHQGARDVPGDGIDQDCSGADARFPLLRRAVIAPLLTFPADRYTKFAALTVKPVRAGDTARLSCRGRGCPLRDRRIAVRADRKRLKLIRYLRGVRLRRGARVTLRVLHAESVGRYWRWKIRAPRRAKVIKRCMAPGSQEPIFCP
jgi:hypothetical protein